ncbi:MAG: flagellar basal body-associated FliL family protein [Chthoniobacteraceae bacterium]
MSDTATATPEAAAAEAPAKKGGGGGMMPVLATIVLVPVLSFVTTQFVLIPKIKAAVGTPAAEGAEAAATGDKAEAKEGAAKAKDGKEGAAGSKSTGQYAHTADFTDIIVNLAGSKGTRYLRSHFMLAGDSEQLEGLIQKNMDQLKDVAISVLSAQTLDSLDVPGAQSAIRQADHPVQPHAAR